MAVTVSTPTVSRRMPLRVALRLDALVTGANGIAYLAAAGPLGDLLGLPTGPLRGIGAFLLAFAAALWAVASRPAPGRLAVRAIVAANVLWAIDSLALLVLDVWTPSTAGAVWIAMQAAVVAGFAALQATARR